MIRAAAATLAFMASAAAAEPHGFKDLRLGEQLDAFLVGPNGRRYDCEDSSSPIVRCGLPRAASESIAGAEVTRLALLFVEGRLALISVYVSAANMGRVGRSLSDVHGRPQERRNELTWPGDETLIVMQPLIRESDETAVRFVHRSLWARYQEIARQTREDARRRNAKDL